MTDYGARVPSRQVRITDRTWNDARADIERLLNELTQLADVTNIVLQEFRISEGGGTTVVELESSGSGQSYFHMGA
jgi:hypothetical protein